MKQTRATKQKAILEEELKNKKTFFSAEEFHVSIKKKHPKIGIATIYRFLSEQVKQNTLHSYTCNRRALFSLQNKTHAHFYCENCHTEKHIEIKNLDFLQEEIPGKICHFQIDIKGICKKCQKD
ncbi:MAG: transcriptional repressor [bacterium]|nr:transcriptional repressor [bacterium]